RCSRPATRRWLRSRASRNWLRARSNSSVWLPLRRGSLRFRASSPMYRSWRRRLIAASTATVTSSRGSATPETVSSAPSRGSFGGLFKTFAGAGELERWWGDRGRRQRLGGGSGLVGHPAAIQQRAGIFRIARKINVLGYRPRPFDDAQAIQLCDNNARHS